MKSEWKTMKLGDLCNISSSKRIFAKEYCDKGIPFYRGKEIIEKHKGNAVSTELFISEERYAEIKQKNDVPKIGDILLSSVGTLGIPWLVDEEKFYFKDGNLTWLRVGKEIDNKFLYLWLCSPAAKQQINAKCIGSTQKAITIEALSKFDICIPTIDAQKEISNMLFAIINKIELNNKINNNLEGQLRAMYYELSSREMWRLVCIDDIAEKVAMGPFGSNIKVSTFVESGIPIISGNHLRGMFLEEPSFNYITEEHAQRLKSSIVYERDIVFTHAGNIGQVAMIPNGCRYAYYVLSQRQFYLRCDQTKALPEYVLLFFHSVEGQQKLLSYANQTGVPSIAQPASNLKKIELRLPPVEKQLEWLTTVQPIIDLHQNNRTESFRLEKLRDNLLPRLMSGELNVSDL
ncbi:MAG: restriction endonuclease subunit S [bacterium]|nr:restriction endonuclease subunit S [bacterium]MCM1424566.1 restriction endonuclease subunit S [bacterium]